MRHRDTRQDTSGRERIGGSQAEAVEGCPTHEARSLDPVGRRIDTAGTFPPSGRGAQWHWLTLLVLATACTPRRDADAAASAPIEPGAAASPTPTVAPAAPRAADQTSSAIDRLARALAASSLSWSDVEHDPELARLADLAERPVGIERASSAMTLLPGYGTVRVPKGAGASYSEVHANEGEAQLNLYGDERAVQWLSVSKFYPERDARAFVARVLPSFRIRDQAPACAGGQADTTAATLFHVVGSTRDSKALSVLVRVDDTAKYGRATTMLDLYTRDPTPFEVGCPAASDQGEN